MDEKAYDKRIANILLELIKALEGRVEKLEQDVERIKFILDRELADTAAPKRVSQT